jgi:hypothetical protein
MSKIAKREARNKKAFLESISALESKHDLADGDDEIVDIISFCNDPKLLNLPGGNLNLFLSQRTVLKCLYMGSRGNEDLRLDEEEMQWLYDNKQDNVIESLKKREQGEAIRISELILVLGRRSSKTVLASVISAYEIYKLLNVGNGDPYKYYGIPYDKEIAVINVATSRKQAGRLFADIKARIRNSPFLNARVENVTSEEIRILTDSDIEKKNDPENRVPVEGSVLIVCGHSNPDSLRGYSTICLLFDELAFYDEGDKISGSYFWNTLKPSVGDFSHMGDGMTVALSSPGPKTGIFYKRWALSYELEFILSFKMATWEFNPTRKYDTDPELVAARASDPGSFEVEYGAEWPEGGMYGVYFPEDLVNSAIRTDIAPEEGPDGISQYYFHVDPANKGDRYVLVCVKKRSYKDPSGKVLPRVALSFTKIWTPDKSMGIQFHKIDEEILAMCRKFRPISVSYDQWNSEHSMEFLTGHGFRCVPTAYNRSYKQKIYQNLKDLMNLPEKALWLYDSPLLLTELKNLKYKPTPRGVSIGADKRGECPTDDLADCLAGASYLACGRSYAPLPQISTVFTGFR